MNDGFNADMLISHGAEQGGRQRTDGFPADCTADIKLNVCHGREFARFQSLRKILDFIEQSAATQYVRGRRFSYFEHDGTADKPQSLQKQVTLVFGQVDMHQISHESIPKRYSCGLFQTVGPWQ